MLRPVVSESIATIARIGEKTRQVTRREAFLAGEDER